MTINLKTKFGIIEIIVSDPEPNGTRSGCIGQCAFRDNMPAINAVESMILAHACSGINVESPQYIEGIETTLDAICNNEH